MALAPDGEWFYAQHPALPLEAAELAALTREALKTSSRLSLVARKSREPADMISRLFLRIADARLDAVPGGRSLAGAEVRLVLQSPLAAPAEGLAAHGRGEGSGMPKDAAGEAVRRAVAQALTNLEFALEARGRTDEELAADLRSGEPLREAGALEQLAARRHRAAFERLQELLRNDDLAIALPALSALVAFGDARAVRPVIAEAERRDDPAFLVEALYALGSLGGDDAAGYLFMIESGHADLSARAAAREALERARRRAGSARETKP